MKEEGPDLVQERFDAAVRVIRTIPSSSFQPSREMTLRFYGLYKQATEGPCPTIKPSFYEVEKSAKWHAWKAEEDLSMETAMDEYVAELKKIVEMMSLTPEVSEFLDKVGNFYELVTDEGKNLPRKKTIEPVQPSLTNGSVKESAVPKPSPPTTLPLKCLLPPVVDATMNEMLRKISDESSSTDEDDLETEAFQDAISHSESEGVHSSRTSSHSNSHGESRQNETKSREQSVFRTLFPELEKLRKRTDRLEQRAEDHAQRLLAAELKLDRLSKQHTSTPVCNGGHDLSATSRAQTAPSCPSQNRIIQLLYRYWILMETRLRQCPAITVLAAILWPLILHLIVYSVHLVTRRQ